MASQITISQQIAAPAIAIALILQITSLRAEGFIGVVEQPCPPSSKVLDPQQVRDFQRESAERALQDWPGLCRYRAENDSLKRAPRVVFMGDSITQNWLLADPSLFSDQVLDRGISGQTTPQMLLRFFNDVINLRPKVVHILAGTNDVAGNTGPTRAQDYRNNIEAMVALARANHIRVVLGSIPPAAAFSWRPEVKPADTIKSLNRWLKRYAASNRIRFVDYYSVLVDAHGGMRSELTPDGVHPNRDGYSLMRPLALASLNRELNIEN